jgi:replicative DNA helicase
MINVPLEDLMLAYAFHDKKHTMELVSSVDVKYFKRRSGLFSLLKAHFNDPKYKEIPTKQIVEERLKENKMPQADIDKVLGMLDVILNIRVDPAEFGWHLNKFKCEFNGRVQAECANNVAEVLSSSTDEAVKLEKANLIIKQTAASIDAINKKQVYKEGSLDESAKERRERYLHTEANPDSAKGVLTGFSQFDRITAGLHPGEFMIVAGDTGTGKSVLMHNIGVNAYLGKNNPLSPTSCIINGSGHNVLYFSLEMPKESIERRIDSCMGEVFYNQLRDGALAQDDKEKYFRVLDFQAAYDKKFHIVDMPKGATTRDIELKFMEVCETKFKPDLVIVDYIGIMSTNNNESDWLALGQVSAELHEFARVYNVPVITGSQVNRPKEAGKQEHSTNRIARSGMVTNNANIIVQIGCRDDEDLRTDMPIFIVKMRDGEKGAFTLSKNFAKMKVVDMYDGQFAAEESADDSI